MYAFVLSRSVTSQKIQEILCHNVCTSNCLAVFAKVGGCSSLCAFFSRGDGFLEEGESLDAAYFSRSVMYEGEKK